LERSSSTSGWVVGKDGAIFEYANFYQTSGTYESNIIDSGTTGTIWNVVFWTEILTSGSDVTISTRTGDTATPDGSWSSWSSELTDETGSDISSPTGQYLQYRVTLVRGTIATETPQLDDISIIYAAATAEHLYGLYITSINDVWAVGNKGVIVHYDGASWSLHTDTGNETWYDITCTSASNCWAVGKSGDVAQYNGSTWTESTVSSSDDINGVYALSASDIWAAGKSGKLWHYDGISWSLHTDTGNETWNDITCTSTSSCWVVGDGGDVAQYDDEAWIESTISPTENIESISAISASNIWAAGANGNIWNYNGISWSLHTDTGNEDWNGIYFVNANDGWVMGDNGTIDRWQGSTWDSFASPTTNDLYDVVMSSATAGWAVGEKGTILMDDFFVTSGTLISSAFNMSDISPVQAIEWDETIPICSPVCDITIDVSTAPDSGGSPGTWTSWVNVTTPEGVLLPTSLNDNQWVRYRLNLTGDGNNTPVLQEIRVNYK